MYFVGESVQCRPGNGREECVCREYWSRGMAKRSVEQDTEDAVGHGMQDFVTEMGKEPWKILFWMRQGGEIEDQAGLENQGRPIPPRGLLPVLHGCAFPLANTCIEIPLELKKRTR